MKTNNKISQELLLDAIEEAACSTYNPGFCKICGFEQDGCEPDAQNYVCENCGAEQVFGAEWLLMEVV